MINATIRQTASFALGWSLISVLAVVLTGTLSADRPFDWALLAVGTAAATLATMVQASRTRRT